MKIIISLTIFFYALFFTRFKVEAKCRKGCDLALASYYVSEGSNLTYISQIFGRDIPEILRYNPHVSSPDNIQTGTRIHAPFSCECVNGDFLGHTFQYVTQGGDTYSNVARFAFANLTTDYWIQRVNVYDPTRVPDFVPINVTVNCSCGDRHVSRDYGLFETYPVRVGESLQSLSVGVGLSAELILGFNQGANFSAGSGIIFLPAKASYYVWSGSNLTFISKVFSTTVNAVVAQNPQITNQDLIQFGSRVKIPFSCGCVNNQFMGRRFDYQVKPGNVYKTIAELYYSNLTTVDLLTRFNTYRPENVPVGSILNVIVNCSCGNRRVSDDYGLFLTYPLRIGESLSSIGNEFGLSESYAGFNPGVDFSGGSGLVFVPVRGISGGAIAGISIAAVFVAILLALCVYFVFCRRKKETGGTFLHNDQSIENAHGLMEKTSESGPLVASPSPKLKGITVDKSVEFTYEELAAVTDNFSLSNKIGQGGFGAVFYGELRGEKAAVKKMDMQASKEFLAELKVLTHVHHVNLVRLIGYCVEGSLFLVYEYIDNGNLSQHLRGKVMEPLPWSTRVQIALDSARGLEYIHEHTVPVYIHRDIKSANILIDKNFRAKVADFGLTKLTEVGSGSLQTRLVGTFGYMPPEYAQYGEVSLKVDVYAFGVVLFELISAKDAIVKTNEVIAESKGLVALFEEAFKQPDQTEGLRKLVDPRLGEDYPFDSVSKVAHLAKACTHENPQLRPSMRSIVVALMTLSSSTEDWDIGSFYENQGLVHLMSGR
ncbi:hypothetical protein MIMGU_mgv1a020123mg [Erythranthe guttata]|uniref:non-specific serine/threonine protein kinase n=1 Tax=Erythranthe guttata TaxID=4155 RepID=A0A022QZ54_ERYGU|nr:hypothetical protein MIMGU_mgv1a020123mg [Erythranthe guttata]